MHEGFVAENISAPMLSLALHSLVMIICHKYKQPPITGNSRHIYNVIEERSIMSLVSDISDTPGICELREEGETRANLEGDEGEQSRLLPDSLSRTR